MTVAGFDHLQGRWRRADSFTVTAAGFEPLRAGGGGAQWSRLCPSASLYIYTSFLLTAAGFDPLQGGRRRRAAAADERRSSARQPRSAAAQTQLLAFQSTSSSYQPSPGWLISCSTSLLIAFTSFTLLLALILFRAGGGAQLQPMRAAPLLDSRAQQQQPQDGAGAARGTRASRAAAAAAAAASQAEVAAAAAAAAERVSSTSLLKGKLCGQGLYRALCGNTRT